MTQTIRAIESAIESYDAREFVESLAYTWGEGPDHEAELEGLGTAKYVDAKLGMEGGGEDIWIVFSLNDELYRLSGYYTSYEGSEWGSDYGGGVAKVTPRETVVVVYDEVKEG